MQVIATASRSTQSPWARAFAPFDRLVRDLTTSPLRTANANALDLFRPPPVMRTRGVVVTEVAGDVALDSAPRADSAASGTAAAHVATTKQSRTYRVRPGDTLWDIARKHRTRVEALLVENRLPKNAALRPGAVLKLPEATVQE
jgi:LysM repeat protein